MSANTIITSVVTGGTNNHTTVAEEANAYATDFVSQGVVGAIVANIGSGGSGSFCVNADASPDMGVTVLAGQAYVSATPSSQDAQVLRARATANYTGYTINANSSGSTKYDWIYLNVSSTNANNPDAAADNVTAIYTSRSTSNTSDTGTPPTYGLLLAVVTVANGASSITNSNITDKRFNTSIGTQNGSLIVTQAATSDPAIIQAAGQDANITLELNPKGNSYISFGGASSPTTAYVATSESLNTAGYSQLATTTDKVTVIVGSTGLALVSLNVQSLCTQANAQAYTSVALSGANTVAASDIYAIIFEAYANNAFSQQGISFLLTGLAQGSTIFEMQYKASGNFATWNNRRISVVPL